MEKKLKLALSGELRTEKKLKNRKAVFEFCLTRHLEVLNADMPGILRTAFFTEESKINRATLRESKIMPKPIQDEILANETLVEEKRNAVEEARKKIDFKMVTFSLAGRDYGIDILRVKEISKVGRFTYVPNTFSFVRGVHNLRGEIISVIDMRVLFNLAAENEQDTKEKIENVLILGLKETKIGVIVDSINKVVGIASETIQPPPPLFKDINVKYISGVVEHEDRLHLILDIERIFEDEGKEKESPAPQEEAKKELKHTAKKSEKAPDAREINFIADTLAALRKFYMTEINKEWIARTLESWKIARSRSGKSYQLSSVEDADEFLKDFYSQCTGRLFDEEYKNHLLALLPNAASGSINAWNPGCGKGFESYSIGAILKLKYPRARIKVWANDLNLLDISTAPALSPGREEIPEYFIKNSFVSETARGFQFTDEMKDAIYFEYHDILNKNVVPEIDFIFARDLLSFMKPLEQEKVVAEFSNKLKPGGMLFIGKNERIKYDTFELVSEKNIVAYARRKEVKVEDR